VPSDIAVPTKTHSTAGQPRAPQRCFYRAGAKHSCIHAGSTWPEYRNSGRWGRRPVVDLVYTRYIQLHPVFPVKTFIKTFFPKEKMYEQQ